MTDADGAVALVTRASNGAPRAELTWIADDDAQPVRTEVPSGTPLDDLNVWWTGEEVMVLGLRCPRWRDADQEPAWSDERQEDALVACGSDQRVLYGWTPGSGRWRTVPDLDLPSGLGVTITGVRGEAALVRRRGVDSDGTARANRLPGLEPAPTDSDVVIVRTTEGSHTVAAIAQADQRPDDDPDQRRPAAAWTYEDGRWVGRDSADVGPGSFPFIAGPALFALQVTSVADTAFVEVLVP